MAYRKIELRTWSDAKFLSLSPPQPCARYLWIYLLTGPFSTPIPGLLNASQVALADALDWLPQSLEPSLYESLSVSLPESLSDSLAVRLFGEFLLPFMRCFSELETSGMARADWGARVVWLPNAIRYNFPQSPNVVKGWKHHAEMIPECQLKIMAFKGFRQALSSKRSYLKAFNETFGDLPERLTESLSERLTESLSAALPYQEQEQEQDKEQEPSASFSNEKEARSEHSANAPEPPSSPAKQQSGKDDLWGKPPIRWDRLARAWVGITEADHARWKTAFPAVDLEAELARAAEWVAANPGKGKKGNYAAFLGRWFGRAQDRAGPATGDNKGPDNGRESPAELEARINASQRRMKEMGR